MFILRSRITVLILKLNFISITTLVVRIKIISILNTLLPRIGQRETLERPRYCSLSTPIFEIV